VRSRITAIAWLSVSIALATFGCGDDKTERGLAPGEELAVPVDPAEMEKTQAERSEEQVRGEQDRERELFDRAEGGATDEN
jgi:hypothetical protein